MDKAKILIVEDEAIIAMEIESQLQGLGYEVTSIVDTGEKAVKKAEEDKPDLILMDIRIKGEMDGIEAAEEIRNRFGIPVIFSTAYLDEERIERAKITMPFGYVLKPIQERDLKVTIEMALYVAKGDAERRKTENTLKKSEMHFRSLFENSPFGALVCCVTKDKKGNINDFIHVRGNSAVEEQTGFILENLINKKASEIASSEVTAELCEIYGGVVTSGIPAKYVQYFDIYRRTLEVSAFHLYDDFFIIIFIDITKQHEAQNKVKLQSKILDCIDQAIIATDLDGCILYFNKFAEKLYHWATVDAIGKNIKEITILQASKEQSEEIMGKLSEGKSWFGKFLVQRKDGSTFMAQVTDSPILDDEGKLICIVSISKEVKN